MNKSPLVLLLILKAKNIFSLCIFFFTLYRPFLCRSGRRSSSMVSRYTSSPTVTLTKMRTSSSRTWSWRWEPEMLGVFLFALIYFLHLRVSRLLQSALHFHISWGIFRHINLLCCPDRITEDCPVNSYFKKGTYRPFSRRPWQSVHYWLHSLDESTIIWQWAHRQRANISLFARVLE